MQSIGGRLLHVDPSGDDVAFVATDPVGPTFDMLLTPETARALAAQLVRAADFVDDEGAA
ncbi:hypothetical protein [Streptomyces sp. SM8]|jgi:hypothetical protein|uniref:hypothetical protein n=1 Tax=Streptomyces sp. SM8 TaxID=1195457 RepID=UPI0002831114|nr:hypothetical protein [Streptomyces sp. SM8]PKA37917.1 hypothetical protein SM8_029285 [Streptomyces sp. SM8]